jgi:DNA-directed RNA polymerase subunit beta
VTKFFPERVRGTRPTFDLVDAKTGEVIAEAGKKVTPRAVKKLIDEGKVTDLLVPFDQIVGRSPPRTSSTKKPARSMSRPATS